jgi:ankyrin repeat protein
LGDSNEPAVLYTLFGLNKAGRILSLTLFVLAVPALIGWTVILPRLRFHEQDEALFRAARHGDTPGIERALSDGARVDAASPVDGRTALFRAAILGHPAAVRALLTHGADRARTGHDGRSALDIVAAARESEHDAGRAKDLDEVASALRGAEPAR